MDHNIDKQNQDSNENERLKSVVEQIHLIGEELVFVAQEVANLNDKYPDATEKLAELGVPKRLVRRLIGEAQAGRMKILMSVTEDEDDRKN